MNRLTPIKCGREIINCKESYTQDKIQQMFLKLGQLEDIEEELGIDLITYFKLKRGAKICVPSLGDNYEIESVVNGMYHICQIGTRSGFYVTTNEYGKTWALTKEELKK